MNKEERKEANRGKEEAGKTELMGKQGEIRSESLSLDTKLGHFSGPGSTAGSGRLYLNTSF